jgi:hypothetical protein
MAKVPVRVYVYIVIAVVITLPGIVTTLLYGNEPNSQSESTAVPLNIREMNMTAHEYTASKCGNVPTQPTQSYWSCYSEASKEFRSRVDVTNPYH